MRIMLDTNILISAIIFPTKQMDSVIYKAVSDYQVVLSSYVIDELYEVINRKFPKKIKDVELFFSRFPHELVYTIKEINHALFSIRNADDYPSLYSAFIEDVDVFVTDDSDFDNVNIERPQIFTPSEFIGSYAFQST